jgi:hypothetical protein
MTGFLFRTTAPESLDFEWIRQGGRANGQLDDALHACTARADCNPFAEHGKLLRVAGRFYFYGSVGIVADPAAEPGIARDAEDEPAEADALDAAVESAVDSIFGFMDHYSSVHSFHVEQLQHSDASL